MRSAPAQLDALMKRCQVGHAKWGDLNNLLAECYGAVGGLRADLEAAEARVAEVEKVIFRMADVLNGIRELSPAAAGAFADEGFAFLAGAPAAPPETQAATNRRLLDRLREWKKQPPLADLTEEAAPEPSLPPEVQRVLDAAGRLADSEPREEVLARGLITDETAELKRAVAALRARKEAGDG